MTDILLHQYDVSPFSEKVRVVLGIKGLAWKAVEQPVIMPKPDLVALTGGYRRIPVMQIGADIYCDTQIIVRELERRFPEPSILVGGDNGLGYGLGFWTDRPLFQAAVGVIFGAVGDNVDEAFKKDREAMMGRPFDTDMMKTVAPLMAEQLWAHLGFVDEQLSDGRAFLLGDEPGLMDADAFYNLAFVRWIHPGGAAIFERLDHLPAWEKRVRDIGHGKRSDLSAEEAIEIATNAEPETQEHAGPGEPNELKPGEAVTVSADDYGRDPISGTLVASSPHHIAIAREDERVGAVVVHFPRAGFFVSRA